MSFCPKCGNEIPQMAARCEDCGYDFSDISYDETKNIEVGAFSTTIIIGFQVISGIMFFLSIIALPFTVFSLDIRSIISNACILFLFGGSYFVAGRVLAISEYLHKKGDFYNRE